MNSFPTTPENEKIAIAIVRTLMRFGVTGKIISMRRGPTVTQYGFEPDDNVKVASVAARSQDLALRLGVQSVRVTLPGTGLPVIGIEIPNPDREFVDLKDIFASEEWKQSTAKIKLALGVDVAGKPVVTDLTRMPHLLLAGTTGAGKSVELNAIINSIIEQHSWDSCLLILIDPKRVEFSQYEGLPHIRRVITDPIMAISALRKLIDLMENRYAMLAESKARDFDRYNARAEKPLPYIVCIVDELGDLMIRGKREVEEALVTLAQKARAVGIHLIISTQRPSSKIITGDIKSNFPTRLALTTASQADSRVIMDRSDAANLLGYGDMVMIAPWAIKPIRMQGSYIGDEEITDRVEFWIQLQQEQIQAKAEGQALHKASIEVNPSEEAPISDSVAALIAQAEAIAKKHSEEE